MPVLEVIDLVRGKRAIPNANFIFIAGERIRRSEAQRAKVERRTSGYRSGCARPGVGSQYERTVHEHPAAVGIHHERRVMPRAIGDDRPGGNVIMALLAELPFM